MPKPRVIDPSFWEDIDVASVSRDERLLLIAMMTAGADDHGRIKANGPYLKRLAFAFDGDVSIADCEAMILHIGAQCKNVVLYQVGDERYACFRNWQKYQQIKYQRQSKLPDPEQGSPVLADVVQYSPELSNISEEEAEFPKPSTGRVGLGRVEQGCSRVELDGVDQKPDDDDNLTLRVSKAWSEARGGLTNSLDAQRLSELEAEHGGRCVLDAILEANSARSQGSHINMNYVRAILDRWRQEGRDTPFDPDKKAKEREKAAADAKLEAELAEWRETHAAT